MITHFQKKHNTKNAAPSDPLGTRFPGTVNRKRIPRTLREEVMLL